MTGTLFDGMNAAGAHAERDAPGWTSNGSPKPVWRKGA